MTVADGNHMGNAKKLTCWGRGRRMGKRNEFICRGTDIPRPPNHFTFPLPLCPRNFLKEILSSLPLLPTRAEQHHQLPPRLTCSPEAYCPSQGPSVSILPDSLQHLPYPASTSLPPGLRPPPRNRPAFIFQLPIAFQALLLAHLYKLYSP